MVSLADPAPMALDSPAAPSPAASISGREQDAQKKGRHRHAPDQLVALVELYERGDHPSLEDRTALGQRIGMPTKTVNAWFQNRRAALRKKADRLASSGSLPAHSDAAASLRAPATHSTVGDFRSMSCPGTPALLPFRRASFTDDSEDDDFAYASDYATLPSMNVSRRSSPAPSTYSEGRATWQAEDAMSPKARFRPSQHQQDELRQLYNANPHPSREEREHLAQRIGMRYQSITNWFQNQRSIAKKRKDEGLESSESRDYLAFPPSFGHPSLALPPRSSHPSLTATSPMRNARSSRSDSPYSPHGSNRTRRSRPEPYQLDALKKLYAKTPNPSIEERGALALEINMEVGKITNWFRNLRQTARKRGLRHILGDLEDGEPEADADDDVSVGIDFSRDGTPSMFRQGPAAAVAEHAEDLDHRLEGVRREGREWPEPEQVKRVDMDVDEEGHSTGTDDEYPEAVTPEPSPPPQHFAGATSQSMDFDDPAFLSPQALKYAALEHLAAMKDMEAETLKTISAVEVAGVRVEDALLLLSFQNRPGASHL